MKLTLYLAKEIHRMPQTEYQSCKMVPKPVCSLKIMITDRLVVIIN